MQDVDSTVYSLALGQVISALRKRAQISQADFASAIGVSQPTLSRIERGESLPSAFLFNRMAEVLGTSPADLNECLQATMRRAQDAAQRVTEEAPNGGDVWTRTLQVAGVVGLAGLLAFAVAVALSEREPDP